MFVRMNRVSHGVARVLLEVDRGADPERQREQRHEGREDQRADDALDDPRPRRAAHESGAVRKSTGAR